MEMDVNNVPSFKLDHTKLKCGLFVSRKDIMGSGVLTTFDIRMKRPYHDEVMTTGSVHALEHLLAAYLRSDPLWGDRVIYIGPMGCRTGFYLILAGDLIPQDILPLIERTFDYISDYEESEEGKSRLSREKGKEEGVIYDRSENKKTC